MIMYVYWSVANGNVNPALWKGLGLVDIA
jgi:hypothetical protein